MSLYERSRLHRCKTVGQALTRLYACKPAIKKYKYKRDFKDAWINANWKHALWLGRQLFRGRYGRSFFGRLPRCPSGDGTIDVSVFSKKANRIKHWPEVRKMLIEIGLDARLLRL